MGRPIYPYELGDPDFSWLISHFQENNPEYKVVENTCLPVVFIEDKGTPLEGQSSTLPVLPVQGVDEIDPEEQEIT
jgi:hypothetical protein